MKHLIFLRLLYIHAMQFTKPKNKNYPVYCQHYDSNIMNNDIFNLYQNSISSKK